MSTAAALQATVYALKKYIKGRSDTISAAIYPHRGFADETFQLENSCSMK
jgi:hypothetical protein